MTKKQGSNGKTATSAVVTPFPFGPIDPAAYLSTHVDAQLSPRQACVLRSVFNGLNASSARLENGHHVDTMTDALKYILETIGKWDTSGNSSTP